MAIEIITQRVEAFTSRFGVRTPILLAPMAGVPAPELSIAVARAGGMGACGALLMSPSEIEGWVTTVREETDGPFQVNLWIPDPPPERDAPHEASVRRFLAAWGPEQLVDAGTRATPVFEEQCAALLRARPAVVSSIMGVYAAPFVSQLKAAGIAWFATVSTVAEARIAERAGADVIVAQGAEAGGHRGSFDAASAERSMAGLFALLPSVVDAVRLPVVATGGIADARGIAAAFLLGASAVQIGTGFLRSPEAGIHPAWAAGIAEAQPEMTVVTRAFSGRAGRSLDSAYVRAAMAPDAPAPAPYPVQRALTAPMRAHAKANGDLQRMQAWAGQAGHMAREAPAGQLVSELWDGARQLLNW